MRKENFEFVSKDGFTYNAVLWLSDEQPKQMIQIVHGMTEHMERYEAFASYFTKLGIAVAGFDLRGHGKSDTNSSCAYFKEGDFLKTLEDIHDFHLLLKQRFESQKHILLGFSLGSFLVREYLSNYDHQFFGAIIAGTGQQPSFLLKIIKGLVKKQIHQIGYTQTNDFISNLSFGTYNKKFAPNKTNVDWLCSDNKQLELYIQDAYIKNAISAGLFYELLDSMDRLTIKNVYSRWDKNMPILLISGAEDPVGDGGKGVLTVKKAMEKAGLKQVTCKLYPHGRHDIFHEYQLGIVENLFEDIKNWLEV